MAMDTPSPNNQASPPKSERLGISAVLPLLGEAGPRLYGAVVATLYLSGFLALNSNLAKYGLYDFEFVDTRYFVAGATFLFFLICFYLFSGRAAVMSPRWLAEDLGRVNQPGPRPVWSFVTFLHSLITATFFCCLSATLFTATAVAQSETAVFNAVLGGAFFVFYTFDITNLDLRFPRVTELTQISLKIIAIYFFFAKSKSTTLTAVFFFYVAIFIYINFVLDHSERYRETADRVIFTVVYTVVFFLGSAIGFGALFYGQISSTLGGARPQLISVGVTEEARKAVLQSMMASRQFMIEGQLIYQTPSFLYIRVTDKTLRLRAGDVVTMTISPERAD